MGEQVTTPTQTGPNTEYTGHSTGSALLSVADVETPDFLN